jgi:hypothetical protein
MEVLQLSDLSFEDLKKSIEKYHSLDFNSSTIADADKLLREIIKHFVTQTLVWNFPVLYRARKHSNKNLFENVSELIYPKNPKVYGRLNDIGESLFYGATQVDTAIMEMKPKIGDEITILESKLIDQSSVLKFMEVGVKELIEVQNIDSDFMKKYWEKINNLLVTEENKKRYLLVNSFLVKEITKIVSDTETQNYKGTIAICQFYIKNNDLAHGMIYPSINRKGSECVVIKPEVYDKYFYAERCFKSKVVDIKKDGGLQLYCVDNSTNIDVNGKIVWT